jgi:putative sigma-54 modulation protein
MQLHITPRHLKLTQAIRDFVEDKVTHLDHINNQIIGAHVVLWHDQTRSPEKQFRVKVHLAIPGPDIHAEEATGDLYASIDLVISKLAQQLRKKKTSRLKKTLTKARKEKELRRKRG